MYKKRKIALSKIRNDNTK